MSTLLETTWPLFGLQVRTPRLTLRYVDDERAAALLDLAATVGVHDPERMPFSVPWTRFDPPVLQRQGLQFYWRVRAGLSPDDWTLPFAVYEGEELVGVQDLAATAFPVTRRVATGSWLRQDRQGRGIGKEMRAAVLALAFRDLGAQVAETSAFADNPASIGVTRALGYDDNGAFVDVREGVAVEHLRFVLRRPAWRSRDDVEVVGLDPCLPLLGL